MLENNPGIYQIENTLNKKQYIGSSVALRSRINSHKNRLRNNKHGNQHLQNAWNKYGEENFKFSLVLYCDKEDLFPLEQKEIDERNPEYNIAKCARAPALGVVMSAEQKAKISKSHIGKTHSQETKEKLSKIVSRNNLLKEKRNRPSKKHPVSKYKGVCYHFAHKRNGKKYIRKKPWSVKTQYRKKRMYLGYFETEVEAAKAYDDFMKKKHGTNFKPNFPENK